VNKPRKAITLEPGDGSVEARGAAVAEMVTSPEVAAQRIIQMMNPAEVRDMVDVPTLLTELTAQIKAVNNGDTSRSEAMLISQATALQSVFVRLSELSLKQDHIHNLESFMRLALRAQSQCRTTLEALSAIKNPPVVYAHQANIAHGHQQVNNIVREIENQQNQLSGATCELRQNTRASGYAVKNDSPVETVGEVDWTTNRGRKKKVCDAGK
jgi:hypothetical protein